MERQMTLSAFSTAQIIPIYIPTTKTLFKPTIPIRIPVCWRPPVSGKLRIGLVVSGKSGEILDVKSSAAAADVGVLAVLERRFNALSPSEITCKKKGRGKSGGGGGFGQMTLERPKVEPKPKQKQRTPELETGGGGGDIGKRIHHGGGDGGDDDDDDDYIDDFDDGDEGDQDGLFRRRILFKEIFDRKFLDAVLNEWQKTMMDLPAGLRQACELGLVSSAQMVKFLAINARPTITRSISRVLPQGMSREFIGRMLADPAFLYRLLLEQVATIGFCTWLEFKTRKERIMQEWDLALLNVLTATACNAIVVVSLAPCRFYGNMFRFDLQNPLQKLPNNVFETSYPLREFDLQKRLQSFLYKAAKLCTVGFTAGAAQGALSNLCASKKERLSVTIPTVMTNALGYGAFLGLFANLRYQLLCGVDRTMINYFDVVGVALFFSTASRLLNVQIGETSRRAWLGIETDPLPNPNVLLNSYNRPSEHNIRSSSNWFTSKKNDTASGLDIKQGQGDSAAPHPKARKERIAKRKVA